MKKKIRDLTEKEMSDICHNSALCPDCPLNIITEHWCIHTFFLHDKLDLLSDDFLDKEVEVK